METRRQWWCEGPRERK
ncbi:unnamed protein product [Spirodela intermedia]|uniref:Uncharacterized protein n=1 Tax=Spirodela intermedia TaxID=51605 RepID=A0A7I8JHT3_SPIIN|nr:unnamed protein product [Spirodela intermedia]CAA6669717.1 unnamed protein product [Spirodela intermedia]